MMIFFVGIIWIRLLIWVFADLIFFRHDISGFVKACWLIFVMVLPFVYLSQTKGRGNRAIQAH